jgi:AcrR family transcriptional regulator
MVLQDSLVSLMKQKPITSITITELCEKADINRTTFYAHYTDQYHLLKQMEEETIAYFDDILNKYESKYSKREVLQMIEEMFQHIADNSNSIQVLLSENGDINFQKKLFYHFLSQQQVMANFTGLQNNKEIIEYRLVFIMNGFIGVIQHWLKNNMNISVTELAKTLINLTYQ